jgi:cytochrome P450
MICSGGKNMMDIATDCPTQERRGDSKTARLAANYMAPEPGSLWIGNFERARKLLRSGALRQAGVEVAPVEKDDPTRASIFFLDGAAHQKRRAAILPFFTHYAIATRHLRVMQENANRLLAEFRQKGQAQLDDLSLRLAGAVVAEIVGLTNSRNFNRMLHRIEWSNGAPMAARGGLGKLIAPLVSGFFALQVFYFDVQPAVAARRALRQDDVISRLLDEGRSEKEILVECLTFGLAGMTTTREFIVVAAWHLFDNDELRRRFLDSDESDQHDILKEILRLEPVASMIWRSAAEDLSGINPEPIPAGARLSFDIRAANLDETAVGACPLSLDPDRAKRLRVNGNYLSFGGGAHSCPGSQVALAETRVFLNQLFRVPGIRLVRPPDMHFVPPMLMSYELRNALVACNRG